MSDRSISVIMSVYHKEVPEYLDMALKSVWDDQSLKPEKIILVEDGKLTTGLYTVISKWAHKIGDPLLILKNKMNVGLTKSLNMAIEYATSAYIARMDSDDISLPDRFAKQVAFFEANPDYDVVGSLAQEIDENGNFLSVRTYPKTHKEVENYICKACPLQHAAVLLKREIFDQGIRYNENYRLTQDLALWFTIIKAGFKIGNIQDCLLLFRINQNFYNTRTTTKAYHEFEIYMKGIAKTKGISWRYIYPISRFIMRHLPQNFLKTIYDSPIRKSFLK